MRSRARTINNHGAIVGTATYTGTATTAGSHGILLMPAQVEREVDADTLGGDTGYFPIIGTNNQILPGQQVNLQLTLPSGVTASNITWTIPGSSFKDYVIASDGSSAATPTQLQTTDLQNPTVTFYWADAGTKHVTCTFTVLGQQTSISVDLTVIAPQSTYTRVLGQVIQDGGSTMELNNIGLGQEGIQWSYSVSLPSSFDSTKSKCGLVQLIKLSRQFTVRTDATSDMIAAVQTKANPGTTIVAGGSYKALLNGIVSCDTQFPYRGHKYNCDGSQITSDGDSPSSGGSAFSDVLISPAESFQTFLTIFPEGANSRPVPLRVINWSWGGELTYASPTWTLGSTTEYATPSSLLWNPTLSYPTWNQFATAQLNLINH